jgi:hypothetical protein
MVTQWYEIFARGATNAERGGTPAVGWHLPVETAESSGGQHVDNNEMTAHRQSGAKDQVSPGNGIAQDAVEAEGVVLDLEKEIAFRIANGTEHGVPPGQP